MAASSAIDPRVRFQLLLRDEEPPLDPDDRGATLLAHVLAPRAHRVYWPLTRPWPEDAEALVHDTRVASRRLVEALALLAPMLGRRARTKATNRAKALRRALGAAREADVRADELATAARAAGVTLDPALAPRGGDPLGPAKAAYPLRRVLRHGLDLLALIARPKRDLTLRAVGSQHLYLRCARAEPLLATLEDPDALEAHHKLRICFKHLRYTVELLAAPFADHLDGPATIRQLKSFQDGLGAVNDAKDLLGWLDAATPFEGRDAVRSHVADDLARRGDDARHEIAEAAPALLGRLRRAAGHFGPLTTER